MLVSLDSINNPPNAVPDNVPNTFVLQKPCKRPLDCRLGFKIEAVERRWGKRGLGMYGAFEAIVVGKKLAARAGDPVHGPALLERVSDRMGKLPKAQERDRPCHPGQERLRNTAQDPHKMGKSFGQQQR